MAHPRELDEDLIDAYRARRALDYLVGFTLSPVLWRKLPGAKSAGRVQSVALRLIVDREREIELFRAQEYWCVAATMEQDGTEFSARLVRYDGEKIDRLTIGDEGTALAAKKAVEDGRFSVVSVETKPLTRNPPPPFTTSTLQQEAARKLGFSASQTMRVAQSLYEDGAITYMRTDGVQMAPEAISAARRAVAGPLRCRLRSRQAAALPDQGQERAGSARSDPADRFRPRPRRLGRPCAALRADLEARAGEPDGLGAARAHDGRAGRRHRPPRAARDRAGRALPRLPRALRGRPRRRGRRGIAPAAAAAARATRRPRSGSTPSSISPSRRRAIPKRAWSSGWRSSASAALRPTPRRSRR